MSEKLSLTWRQAAMESPHTFAFQVVNTAAQWHLEITWNRMTMDEARVIQAWLNSLRGQVGTFTYSPFTRLSSSLTGRTLAAAAFAYGTTVSIGGWAANAASALSLGQYLAIGDQLLQITSAPTNADANGRCLIEFSPMLRKNYASGVAVEFVSPKGVFRLLSADTPGFAIDADRIPELASVSAKEAIG